MTLKNRAKKALKLYFVLFTLISILLMILGLLFDADRPLGYQVFLSPLIYAALGVIPVLLLNQEKELSVKGLIIRRIIELVLIEAIYLVLSFSSDNIPTEKFGVIIGISVGVAIVYGITILIEYIFESVESKEMNEYLYSFQNRQNG